jgi:hypothetical protein
MTMELKSDDSTQNKEILLRNLGFEGQQLTDLLSNKKISDALVQMVKEVPFK